jgi:two-component system cell cycle sensor histidine kinase/response regulator CckA
MEIVKLPRQHAPDELAAGAETVLLVEDEGSVRHVLTEMLEGRGYRVTAAANGPEALALAETAPHTIDLLLTDLVMPGLNGRETAAALRESQPQAKVLYMSGYTDDIVVRCGGLEPGTAFIQKPFGSQEIVTRVREILGARPAEAIAV